MPPLWAEAVYRRLQTNLRIKLDSTFQARPNVIFELGWFYANLGRSRVCILDKSSEKSKIFSDLQDVIRIQFSENISEKIIDIERELRSVGIIA